MKKVVKIKNKTNETSENLKFWAIQSSEDKISAIQELRESYIALFGKEKEYDESRKRLRRVCRAVKQA